MAVAWAGVSKYAPLSVFYGILAAVFPTACLKWETGVKMVENNEKSGNGCEYRSESCIGMGEGMSAHASDSYAALDDIMAHLIRTCKDAWSYCIGPFSIIDSYNWSNFHIDCYMYVPVYC